MGEVVAGFTVREGVLPSAGVIVLLTGMQGHPRAMTKSGLI